MSLPCRWHIAMLLLVAAAAAGCGQSSGAVEGGRQHPQAGRSKTAQDDGRVKVWPESSNHAEVGAPYRWGLYTHCGLEGTSLDFDGSFWDFQGPGRGNIGGNPPPGFGNPFDQGKVTLISEDVAKYRSSSGKIVRFTRHEGPVRTFVCL